jgi:hypothetical protein
MGGFRTIAILAAGAAVGGALMIAHRVSEDTGKTLTESFSDVPAEAQRIFGDVKSRANDAVSKARQTYEGKQAEMDAYLHGGGPAV